MSRTLRNRKRPDSVRMPNVPGLSKHPTIMARSVSAGPHSSASIAFVPASRNITSSTNSTPPNTTATNSISASTPATPTLNRKYLEKIPSISAQSESSEEDEDDTISGHTHKNSLDVKKVSKENDNVVDDDDDDDDDDSVKDRVRKRISVITQESTNTHDWSPTGINGSIHTKTISTKMASGIRACKTTGRNIIRMLSTTSTRRNSKSSCSVNSEDCQANKEDNNQRLNKVIMLGDSGVGKTSLLIMFRDGVYMPCYYVTTVGIDFMNKVVVVDGTRVKLQIWDTAGQERFRSVTHAYYRDAHALLLLYDVTNKTTYDNIRAWLCEIRDCAQEDVVIVLIGNKSDCSSSERQVKREDGERLAREHNVPFMETSAKTGLNVELAFQTVARQLKNRGYDNGDDGKFNVHEFVRDNTKAKSICAQCSF